MNEYQTYHATNSGHYLDVCDMLVAAMGRVHNHTTVRELLEQTFLESYWYAVYHRRQYDHFTVLERG